MTEAVAVAVVVVVGCGGRILGGLGCVAGFCWRTSRGSLGRGLAGLTSSLSSVAETVL